MKSARIGTIVGASISLCLCGLLSGCFVPEPAPSASPGCFETHVRDAIASNENRKTLYSSATDGSSGWVSDLLIAGEKLTLYRAQSLDSRLKPYNAAGIPLICEDLAPMSSVPRFSPLQLPPPSPFSSVPHPDLGSWKSELNEAIDSGDFDRIHSIAEGDLGQLSVEPRYYCMLRHFVETISHTAAHASERAAQSQAHGLDASRARRISLDFIELQNKYLREVGYLDEMAAKTQETGVPLLCNDLPRFANEGGTSDKASSERQ